MIGAKIKKLTVMKSFSILKSKLCEIHFGLFAPCLMLYKNGYSHDNRLELSLILVKIYLTLNKYKKDTNKVTMYGFYFKSDPASFIFIWNEYNKSIIMPWHNVLIKRQLLTSNGIILLRDNECLSLGDIKELMKDKEIAELCTCHYKYNDIDYKYYVTYIVKCPAIFKKLKWFSTSSFEIYTTLSKPLKHHSFTRFKTGTKYNIAIPHQINTEIAALESKPF
jgi:hypothetical protein